MDELLQKLYEYLAFYGLKVLAAVVVLVIGRIAAKLLSSGVEKAMLKARVDATLAGFSRGLCNILLMVVVIIAALKQLGFETNSFVAMIGAAGLAVGFALQGSLGNFAAGIMLVTFKPFKVGDFVEIGGKIGTVREIHIFNTMLDSPDNIRIVIPNSQVTGGSILNYTANGTRRVDLVIGVSYEDDLQKVESVIKAVINDDKRVLPEPVAVVAVNELGDSSVNFVVRPWVQAADYWDVYFGLTGKIKTALDDNGVTIPYPQRVVHMKNVTEGS